MNKGRKEGSARVMLMCSVKHNPGNGGNSVKYVRCSRNFPAILAAREAVEVTLQQASTTNQNIKNICDLAKKTERWMDGMSV